MENLKIWVEHNLFHYYESGHTYTCVCAVYYLMHSNNRREEQSPASKWRNNWGGQVAHQVSIKTTPGDPSYF